jgi:hypothetical protein
MSENILDELFPEFDNDPTNYRLIKDLRRVLWIIYVPDDVTLEFLDGNNERDQIIRYLIANGVEIEEGSFDS